MGLTLTKLAKDCDCFQIPWEYPEQSQSGDSEGKQGDKGVGDANIFHDKQIIFQNPMQSEQMNNVKPFTQQNFKFVRGMDDSRTNEEDSVNNNSKGQQQISQKEEQMEIIDLDKITPQIEAQAFKRAAAPKQKPRKFPLMVKELYGDHQQEPSDINQNKSQTLSNIFQQNGGRYFIERDDEEFYGRLDHQDYAKSEYQQQPHHNNQE